MRRAYLCLSPSLLATRLQRTSYSSLAAMYSSQSKCWTSTHMKSKLSTKTACRPQYDLEFKTSFLILPLETHDWSRIILVRYMNARKMDKGRLKKAPKFLWAASYLFDFIWLSEMMFTGINSIASNKNVGYRGYIIKWQWYRLALFAYVNVIITVNI